MNQKFISRSPRFRAKWICVNRGEKIKNSFYYFRKEFDVHKTEGAFIRITADNRYRLFINGQYVGYGSLQTQPYFKYFDTIDVSSCLKKGRNCVAVEISFVGKLAGTIPGLLLEITDGDGNYLCGTDENFRGILSPAYRSDTTEWSMSYYRSYQEVFDARKEPEGWKTVGFDDSSWKSCDFFTGYGNMSDVPIGGIWSRMVERDIPFMDESQTVYAEKIVTVQEHTDLQDRFSLVNELGVNLAHPLSQPGKPLEYASVENAEALCNPDGVTIMASSSNHLDHNFGSIYSPSVLLDFGRIINAFPVLTVEGEPGAQIVMGFAERLVDGHFFDCIECPFANSYTLRGGEEEIYIPFTWQAFRYVRIQLHGGFKGVRIKGFGARLTRYPYEEKGAFSCTNEKYNRLFEISRHTIDLCSNECLMDTPFREQGQFLGDVCAVTLGGIYACFGNTVLPSKYLRQSGENQVCTGMIAPVTNYIYPDYILPWLDYSLYWVIALWEHYIYTGDEVWLHRYYPHAVKMVEYLMPSLNEDGLLENTPTGPFIDWSPVDKHGEIAVLNAIYFRTMQVMSQWASFKHDDYMKNLFDEIADGIQKNFVTAFYDPKRKCIVDSRCGGVQSSHINESAPAAALYYELLPDDVAKAVISSMYEEKNIDYVRSEPFFTWFVLRGLMKQNRPDLAMQIINDRYIKLMVDQGATSIFEEWSYNGSWRTGEFSGFMRTQSHAWSACPAEFFLKTLIGLEILTPGGTTVQVNPKYAGFDYDVTYPLNSGKVCVRCRDGKFDIHADSCITIKN